jgi:hypothetical protein
MIKRFVATTGVFAAALALVAGVAAQDMSATPDVTSLAHPAHIHSGSCPDVGDVVYPLEYVTVKGSDVLASPETDMAGLAMDATPTDEESLTLYSTTTVEASLDDILGAEHAINVHESDENIQNYIACGDVTGMPGSGELEITLEELNDSGASGTATLTDNGDGTTTVVIELTHDGTATPEASPMS